MQDNHVTFDRRAVRQHRDRAASLFGSVSGILEEAADRLLERLDDITRPFSCALDIGGRGPTARRLRERGVDVISCDLSPRFAQQAAPTGVCADEEFLPFGAGTFDLVVANLSLHWVNDLPGTLLQIRHALKPDGLLLASMPVLPTLSALRQSLTDAELALSGGVSPRVSPFPTPRDCASLLQRAGFALPVVDIERLDIRYRSGLAVLRDLRAAGETNAVALRSRRTPPSPLFPAALGELADRCADTDGILSMPLDFAVMSAWSPAPTQPQPLAPGAFNTSLRDVLENAPADDKTETRD